MNCGGLLIVFGFLMNNTVANQVIPAIREERGLLFNKENQHFVLWLLDHLFELPA